VSSPEGRFTLVERRVAIHAPLYLTDAQVEAQIDHAVQLFDELLEDAAKRVIEQIDLPNLSATVLR
jgi:hypothetical protein